MRFLWTFVSVLALLVFSTEGCKDVKDQVSGSESASMEVEDFSQAGFNLAEYKGKALLLNFWATWCPPCRAEIPHLASLYNDYKDRGFEIVGISLGEEPSHVQDFLKDKGVNYRILVDRKGNSPQLLVREVVRGIPTSYLIDQDGKVFKKYVGYPGETVIKDDIDKLLSK